ncbi:MAG TPA: hypothetical protein VNB06_04520 [Thermoanaerobaculia bacterium]|nr:hypothetical protein [Thermoanaerobaculia bacterium]
MSASIDFWLDELDTQITQLSPDQLQALREGSGTCPVRERNADGGGAVERSAATSAGESTTDWVTWTGVAAPGFA